MSQVMRLDCTGLACPEPVMQTKRLLDTTEVEELRVTVDNFTSKENVARFALNQKLNVEVREVGADVYELLLRRNQGPKQESSEEPLRNKSQVRPSFDSEKETQRLVIYIGRNTLGSGADELGAMLMRGFLRTVLDSDPQPWRIVLINSGVKLGCTDDEAVEALHLLADKGCEVLLCGTCLDYFGLTKNIRVGRITNMYEVVSSLNEASKVISPA